MRIKPKRDITNVRLKSVEYGNAIRKNYPKKILEKAPVLPKPLEYEDIDKAFFDFVDKEITIIAKNVKVPTFTLYSSQRFSEYSQTWKYTDDDGNLLMNFKTVNRDNDPGFGDNQGGLWNIPGDRKYTMIIREVMEDNGNEYYDVYSMKQPYAVNLSYRINFVTNIYENINAFNQRINELFKARQCYIRPNGHFIPMVIDEINDETQYGIEDRKFYVQSIVVKAMAYIIHEKDFTVERKPKNPMVFMEGESKRRKPNIDITEFESDVLQNKTIDISIGFNEWYDKAEFDIDCDVIVENIKKENIRSIRLFVNDTPTYIDKGFKLKDGDNVKIKIRQVDITQKSQITLMGYDPNFVYNSTETPENVSEEVVKHETITVD